MRVMVTGANGTLGRWIGAELLAQKHKPLVYGRDGLDLTRPQDITRLIGTLRPDILINCAGIVKQRQAATSTMIAVNALGPHLLAESCDLYGCRLVQISTDCVFSGKGRAGEGPYTEGDTPDGTDVYGRSKALGEVTHGRHLTIRGSFVAPGKRNLLGWFLAQTGEVKGYTEAFWNGLTVDRFAANVVLEAVKGREGLLHIASAECVTKAHLLALMAEAYGKSDVTVVEGPTPAAYQVKRELSSIWRPRDQMPLREQLKGLAARGRN